MMQTNLLICLTAVLMLPSCHLVTLAHGNDSREGDYFTACVRYLEGAIESIQSGGLSQLVSDGYKTYLEYPSGPYMFCFNQDGLSEDAVRQSVMVLHPFTPRKTMEELLDFSQEGSLTLLKDKEEFISSAVNDGRLGKLFNYTEPYSLNKSMSDGGINVDGDEKKVVGVVVSLEDGTLVQCGCRYTGVPDGERDNTNAIQGGGEAPSSTSTRAFSFFSLVLLFILHQR
ncbi:hypothetical protein PSENEW3_00002390 [Picochlorum sp. SENEW3]|nr:hypothetical protein PSENEW3_00002390 [Picochlorum sp. SENEW3]